MTIQTIGMGFDTMLDDDLVLGRRLLSAHHHFAFNDERGMPCAVVVK